MIDGTESMTSSITSAKNEIINISNQLKKLFPDFKFQFGCILYRDPIDSPSDSHSVFQLTNNVEILKNQIARETAKGGGDLPEDWVGAYTRVLDNISWRNGTKLIIQICDAGAHGTEFTPNDKYPSEGPKLVRLIERLAKKNIKIISFKIGSHSNNSLLTFEKYYKKFKGILFKTYDFNVNGSIKNVSTHFRELVIEAATVAAPKNSHYQNSFKKIFNYFNSE